jgi:hypothetical protein
VMADQKEVLVYVSHRSWRCWRTRRLLERRGVLDRGYGP